MKSALILLLLTTAIAAPSYGQSQKTAKKTQREQYEEELRKQREEFKSFNDSTVKVYDDFRMRANKEYADFVEKTWEIFQFGEPEPYPEIEEVAPLYIEDDDTPTASVCYNEDGVKLLPGFQFEPQPKPISPISAFDWKDQGEVHFKFYGTDCTVRFDDKQKIELPDLERKTIANAWRTFSEAKYNNTINDCLKIRRDLNLNDWAYLQFLQAFTDIAMSDENAARLFMSFLYTQSGYQSRLIKTREAEPKLSMLYGSKYILYGKKAYKEGDEFFYTLNNDVNQVEFLNLAFPQEQAMAMSIENLPKLKSHKSESRIIRSKRYPNIEVEVSVDENLISFYNDYPSWGKEGDILTKWEAYALTPIDKKVQHQLYPQLLANIDTVNKRLGVEQLLNFVQTGFVYEYDEKVWGKDRAFFAEETLYYPYCDCEDRAILFSHLVRDLLGLDVALVYYPGHLATAVNINDPEQYGDYIKLRGKKFYICDPTIIAGPAGRSMSSVDKNRIQAVVLKSPQSNK